MGRGSAVIADSQADAPQVVIGARFGEATFAGEE